MKMKKTLDRLVGKGSLALAGAAMLLTSCTPWMYTTRADSATHRMNVVVYNSAVDQKPVYLTERQFAENKPLQEALYAQAVKANDAYFGINAEPVEEAVEEVEAEGEVQIEMVPPGTDLDKIMDEPIAEEKVTEPVAEVVTEEKPVAEVEENSYTPLQLKWEMQKKLVDEHEIPVIIDVTKNGVYFCTEGIGKNMFHSDGVTPYLNDYDMLKNGKCDPSERIKNYVDGGELFNFAYLKTLQGFDEMETFRKSLLYKPLGEEE